MAVQNALHAANTGKLMRRHWHTTDDHPRRH